jgi:GAF domain-containing protein
MLEMRAVAGNDKLKAGQILALKIPQEDCSAILKNEYVISRSYLINKEEAALRPLKHIYQRERSLPRAPEDWPPFALLTVPIRSRYDKIIGFLILDNPADKARPSLETIRLLELLANQISVAMENRVLYLQAKKEGTQSLSPEDLQPGEAPPRGIRRLFRKLFSYR